METQKISLIFKIISVLSFLSALITGFLTFWIYSWSHFSSGLSAWELIDVSLSFVATIVFIVAGVYLWKGRKWAKIVTPVLILGLVVFIIMFS